MNITASLQYWVSAQSVEVEAVFFLVQDMGTIFWSTQDTGLWEFTLVWHKSRSLCVGQMSVQTRSQHLQVPGDFMGFFETQNQMFIFKLGTFMAASPTSFDISIPRGHFGS